MAVDVAAMADRLSMSQRIAIQGGRTWSGAQRNRLIALGIAPETCRGAPPLPKQYYEIPSYALPLTSFGLAVREYILAHPPRRKGSLLIPERTPNEPA